MKLSEITIGEWLVLPGFERNRPVKVLRINSETGEVWVKMPEGDRLPVDSGDLRRVGE